MKHFHSVGKQMWGRSFQTCLEYFPVSQVARKHCPGKGRCGGFEELFKVVFIEKLEIYILTWNLDFYGINTWQQVLRRNVENAFHKLEPNYLENNNIPATVIPIRDCLWPNLPGQHLLWWICCFGSSNFNNNVKLFPSLCKSKKRFSDMTLQYCLFQWLSYLFFAKKH